jgi:hypothetical protein
MIKAVADRLAEAFTELMHFKLRTELWGYSTEAFNNQQLIQEKLKYLASGLAKYQPLTLAVGSMAYELVRVIPVFFSTLSKSQSFSFSLCSGLSSHSSVHLKPTTMITTQS